MGTMNTIGFITFGLCNAPAVFQRLIHKVLSIKKNPGVLAYTEYIIIASKTVAEGLEKLRDMLYERVFEIGNI